MKNKTRKTRNKETTYSEEDYASSDGFLTTVWGPMLWSYLHTMSFNYPVEPTQENKVHYREFILNLQNVLPCKYCRMNLTKNLKTLPLTMADMKNRDTFSRYVYNLHEVVNKMLKKTCKLSYEEVRDRYENFRSRCTQQDLVVKKTKKNTTKKEKGCTTPLYGKKSKCVIKIIPQENKEETFQMDKKCIKSKTNPLE